MVLCFLVTYPKRGSVVKQILIDKGYNLVFQDYNEILVFEIPKKDLDKIKKIKYIKKLFPITIVLKFDISLVFKFLEIFKNKQVFFVDVRIRDNKVSSRDLKRKIVEFLKPYVDKYNFDKYLIIQSSKDKIFVSILDKNEYFERKIENFSLKNYIKNKYKIDNFRIIETKLENLDKVLSRKYKEQYIVLVVELPNESPKTISNLFDLVNSTRLELIHFKRLIFLPNNMRIIVLKNI